LRNDGVTFGSSKTLLLSSIVEMVITATIRNMNLAIYPQNIKNI
jgi:hypothetical protein